MIAWDSAACEFKEEVAKAWVLHFLRTNANEMMPEMIADMAVRAADNIVAALIKELHK